jgi:hypothetical protein
LTQFAKTFRYSLTNAIYVRLRPRGGDAHQVAARIANQNVLITIAFGDCQALEWQIVLLRRYVKHGVLIIADNSQDHANAISIQEMARRLSVPYIRLPRNFAKESRSHGLALNWVWRNIVCRGKPAAFGFLDHDLFPTKNDEPFRKLETQPFFGVLRSTKPRWFLWAGFCLFRFDAVKTKTLDFGQDWFVGLDTGGGNWDPLYSQFDLAELKMQPIVSVPYREGVSLADGYFQWCDGWVHEVGVTGRRDLKADKRKVLTEILAPHLAADALREGSD